MQVVVKAGRTGRIEPFDMVGLRREADGKLGYEGRPHSLVALLRGAVDAAGEREAVSEPGGARLSYAELWDASARVAGGLRQRRLRPGDRAAIRLGNGVDWCQAFLGCLLAGVVPVPVNTRLTEAEVGYILGNSGATFVFTPGERLPDGRPYADLDTGADALAAIFYTSGTTGFPKGAVLSHRSLLSTIESQRRALRWPYDGIRNLVGAPLFHVSASVGQLLTTLALRGSCVILPGFNAATFAQAITDQDINCVIAVPAMYAMLLRNAEARPHVGRLRYIQYGAAPSPPALIAALMEAAPGARLGNGFGLTETSALATFLPHEFAALRPDSVGFALPAVELDLVTNGLGEDDVGELLVRGSNLGLGYWQNPEATEAAFAGGWLHTGDIARIDDDGFVQILDRRKDMINRGGENVYCVEVENALISSGVLVEAAVVGVPDDVMGQKVGAILVVEAGQRFDAIALHDHLAERLAGFKIPEYLVVQVTPLPRTASGKVAKTVLAAATGWRRWSELE